MGAQLAIPAWSLFYAVIGYVTLLRSGAKQAVFAWRLCSQYNVYLSNTMMRLKNLYL
jgi:hypothetical protein